MTERDGITHDDAEYTARLGGQRRWWKRALGVDRWYGSRARRAARGRTLEIGSGIGRLLKHLDPGSIGVDTNPHSVAVATQRGLNTMTDTDLASANRASLGNFDALLFAHVLEHMTNAQAADLVADYLSYLSPGGRVVVIVPQEAGFRSDPTHVQPVDATQLGEIASANDLTLLSISSFPFPRFMGKIFRYNETVAVMVQEQG